MTAVRLSERMQVALLALADHDVPIGGGVLAGQMSTYGREWSPASAHQAASGLCDKGLAVKAYPAGATHIRYEITDKGRKLAARIRAAS